MSGDYNDWLDREKQLQNAQQLSQGQERPPAVIEKVMKIIYDRMKTQVPENKWFTRAMQSYAAGAIGRVLAEAVHVGVTEGASGARKRDERVTWDLEYRTSPIPLPTWGAPWSFGGGSGEPEVPWTGELYAPNRLDIVEETARQYDWLMKTDPASFTRLVAKKLNELDAGFGLKSRPGGPISKDTLAYRRPDGQIEAIDILTGSGTGNPTPKWANLGPVPADWHQP